MHNKKQSIPLDLLDRLRARPRGVLRDQAAQRVVMVVLLRRATCIGYDAHGA